MYHSIIILADGRFYNSWDDWHLIPSTRPVIAAAKERTNFVTVGGRDGVLDFSQTLAGRPTFDDRAGSLEFYVENDYWDWETAYTTICGVLQGKRIKMALEDNPSHYYEGLLYVDKWTSDKGHSKISLKYDLHPTMQTLDLDTLEFVETALTMNPGMVTDLRIKVLPSNTFYRKVNITSVPAGIAEVTADGLVRALQAGSTEIRAVCGPLTAICRVEVLNERFWNLTMELDGCAETNHTNRIQNGGSYENILTAPDGYLLTKVEIFTDTGRLLDTVEPEKSGKNAIIRLTDVSGNLVIRATLQEVTRYTVTWALDCVEAVDPVKTVREGDTVKFKIKGVTTEYVLNHVIVEMNGYERLNRVAWDGLNEATITLTVDGDITITADALAYFKLSECSWEMIDRIARSGRAAEYFSIGDRKSVDVYTMKNNDRNTAATITVDAFILGINHNPAVEGNGNIHFGLGKVGMLMTTLLYNCYVNSTATNTDGIEGSEVMSLIGSEIPYSRVEQKPGVDIPDGPNPPFNILWNLPYELTQVILKAPKTVYDTKTGDMVTHESYLWLMSETEVYGAPKHGYAVEANTQKQYAYFAKGNRKIMKDPDGATVKCWLRSPARDVKSFCRISTDGTEDYGWAYNKMSVFLCFALGVGTTAKTGAAELDKTVLG